MDPDTDAGDVCDDGAGASTSANVRCFGGGQSPVIDHRREACRDDDNTSSTARRPNSEALACDDSCRAAGVVHCKDDVDEGVDVLGKGMCGLLLRELTRAIILRKCQDEQSSKKRVHRNAQTARYIMYRSSHVQDANLLY
jgi:hypothetical protein